MKEKETLNRLLNDFPELVHPRYPFPEPYIGSGEIKAIILGADPTRMVNGNPQPFNMVFELDNERSPYWRGIGKNIGLLDDLTMENVYVQNLCRNYFWKETSLNENWTNIARNYWISVLNEELDSQFPPTIPVLMTTEFILHACLANAPMHKARDIYNDSLSYSWKDNLFGREVLALYRHHAYSLDKWPAYARFLSDKISYLASSKPFDNLRVIARRVDGVFLVAIDNNDGFLISDDGKVVSPIMMYDSFLARGYYEEVHYNTDFDLIEAYKDAIKLTRDHKQMD